MKANKKQTMKVFVRGNVKAENMTTAGAGKNQKPCLTLEVDCHGYQENAIRHYQKEIKGLFSEHFLNMDITGPVFGLIKGGKWV